MLVVGGRECAAQVAVLESVAVGCLVIAHGADEAEQLQALSRNTATPMTLRTRAQVARFFRGWDLIDPGLVWAPQWHPAADSPAAEHPERSGNHVAMGRKS